MRFSWGPASRDRMNTIQDSLTSVLESALSLSPFDIIVVCGSRSQEAQETAFRTGKSKVRWPDSMHNCPLPDQLSRAVDIAPWIGGKIPWSDSGTFYVLAGIMLTAANLEGIDLRYGGDWNNNGLTRDQTFNDIGHFYRVKEKT